MLETYRSPWYDLQGYLACLVVYEDGSKRTILQHREVMEKQLKRQLRSDEIVHHKDGNKRNNKRQNLEVTSQSMHAKHHADEHPAELVELVCVQCDVRFIRSARLERQRVKCGKDGPCCGKSCAGKLIRQKQINAGQSNLRRASVAQPGEATGLDPVK